MSEGVVYDLGYRPHEGERLGRSGAVRALFKRRPAPDDGSAPPGPGQGGPVEPARHRRPPRGRLHRGVRVHPPDGSRGRRVLLPRPVLRPDRHHRPALHRLLGRGTAGARPGLRGAPGLRLAAVDSRRLPAGPGGGAGDRRPGLHGVAPPGAVPRPGLGLRRRLRLVPGRQRRSAVADRPRLPGLLRRPGSSRLPLRRLQQAARPGGRGLRRDDAGAHAGNPRPGGGGRLRSLRPLRPAAPPGGDQGLDHGDGNCDLVPARAGFDPWVSLAVIVVVALAAGWMVARRYRRPV